ncbi:DNA dependent DNA polymerase [California sea lion adenovirus 1]|uniref:DNA polymerase n=4 Tax=Mastadenovirus TaxID=10509 RepID=A0A059XN92_9ADEN|nr:DNA dependent DNA polymerase [California sea lion adenovirus 1]AIA22348.1 DNA dependent DNA polymerase [California sea lion adenovirus 1]
MALVQNNRAGGFHSESKNSRHQQASSGLRRPAETNGSTNSRSQSSSRSSSPINKKPRKEYKGTLVAKRATKYAQGTTSEGENLEIKYHSNTKEALINFFNTYLMDLPSILEQELTSSNIMNILSSLQPSEGNLYFLYKGLITHHSIIKTETQYNFPLNFLVIKKNVYFIKEISKIQKCKYCGRCFKNSHTCSARRRDYYFHQINTQSAQWWENIQFFPIGSCKSTERLFITYDVETYTWHGKFGKQLVPFMLVMHLSGDEMLVHEAEVVAKNLNWNSWHKDNYTYYILNPQKQAVGKAFKTFRDALQQKITSNLWSYVLCQNPKISNYCAEKNLTSVDDISFEELQQLKIQGKPRFIEVYIIGHNINGFDEIVLAAQVINNKSEIPSPFKINRNFMPRCGKILFNDITFSLPNPFYQKRKDYKVWEEGICEESDFKYQFVKFMVRDTFALTHTSLRKAANAYDLSVEKGNCPYKAVNEFYMLGSYQQDDDGFPQAKYWESQQEYEENKTIWKKQNTEYDIIEQTLNYCALDVKVTAELVLKLQESYKKFITEAVNLPNANFNILQRPTISSNSHAIFRQILYRAEKPNKPNLGDVIQAPSCELYDYIRESIRGGRCYPTYLGVLEQKLYVYDICGMYASALTHPFPSGRPLNPFDRTLAIKDWENMLKLKNQIDYFDKHLLPGIFTIDATPPDETMLDILPPFCSRKSGRLCWTNEPLRGEIATSIDVITLHNRGWEVNIIPDERTIIWPKWKCIAKEYVQLNIAAKEKADKEKNQTIRSIAKLLSNALYGSFATKLDNKTIVFADQMEDKYKNGLANGEFFIKSSSFIETENLSAEIEPEFIVTYSPISKADKSKYPLLSESHLSDEENDDEGDIYTPSSDVTYKYKPITFLDSEEQDMCLHTLEKNSPLIVNNKYPSQIASFVLAWTRAFVSEWAGFLYEEDLGIPLEERSIKSVYGDTDSIFVTEIGHKLMETKGKNRIKKNGGKLVFDPDNPSLTWLVECETQCEKCGNDAYSSESVFLAPKLYALKNTVCDKCGHVGKGKLRAKGHATAQLSYDLLLKCYYSDLQDGSDRFVTSRHSLQRTLVSNQSHVQPFTVTETTLTRTLRPWKDMTLRALDHHRLIPYSSSHPNPRRKEICWMELPWNN